MAGDYLRRAGNGTDAHLVDSALAQCARSASSADSAGYANDDVLVLAPTLSMFRSEQVHRHRADLQAAHLRIAALALEKDDRVSRQFVSIRHSTCSTR